MYFRLFELKNHGFDDQTSITSTWISVETSSWICGPTNSHMIQSKKKHYYFFFPFNKLVTRLFHEKKKSLVLYLGSATKPSLLHCNVDIHSSLAKTRYHILVSLQVVHGCNVMALALSNLPLFDFINLLHLFILLIIQPLAFLFLFCISLVPIGVFPVVLGNFNNFSLVYSTCSASSFKNKKEKKKKKI